MNVGTVTSDLSFIDHLELLRFVQKQCLRIIETNCFEGHGVWIGLSLAALRRYPDLELRFRKIWVDEKETLCEQGLHETADILESAIARVEASNQTDIDVSLMDAEEDPTEDSAVPEPPESLAEVGRWLLFYLRQEAKQMLERADYECVSVWEDLLRMGLSLILRRGEFRDSSPCLELPPDEKLRLALDVIRDVLFRRTPRHNPWTRTDNIKCSS